MLGAVVAVLRDTVGGTRPRLWTVDTAPHESPALTAMAGERGTVALGDLMRDPVDRTRRLDCVPLVVQSADGATVMPEPSHPLRPGDRILLCGSARAHHLVDATLHNDYTLRYLVSGVDGPRGLVMRWLAPKLAALAGPAERHGAAD